MSGEAYYNEHDPQAAAWLRELIKADMIAPGEVDERDIQDVKPAELRAYRQCHFFAGVGVWSYALRCAGWPDDRPVWTGSCPCQPFSAAGKRKGVADERHLWPAFFWLIGQCRPRTVFGEQVSGSDGLGWLDSVSSDLEGIGYAVGALTLPAAGFGAPHGRHRIYFVADAVHSGRTERRTESGRGSTARSGGAGELGDANRQRRKLQPVPVQARQGTPGRTDTEAPRAGPANGFWRDACWLPCTDGKARPTGFVADAERDGGRTDIEGRDQEKRAVDGGTADWPGPTESLPFPLADGIASRLGYRRAIGGWQISPLQVGAEQRTMRLSGYGNALCAPVAEAFVRACLSAETPGMVL